MLVKTIVPLIDIGLEEIIVGIDWGFGVVVDVFVNWTSVTTTKFGSGDNVISTVCWEQATSKETVKIDILNIIFIFSLYAAPAFLEKREW